MNFAQQVGLDFHSSSHPVIVAGIINGWRDELYGVGDVTTPLANHVLVMERAAATYFGTLQFGVHVNVYVPHRDGGQPAYLWIARRAENKATWSVLSV